MKMDYQAILDKYYPDDNDLRRLLLKHSRHDIGIFRCNAPSICCYGTEPYIKHGPIGGDILRNEGFPRHARVAERHTGTGLPGFEPETLEEQIVCYADKFYSKSSPDHVRTVLETAQSLEKFGREGVEKFLLWAKKFE